ncbi:Uncharacterised protein [Yersinia intermedia]|nr:hypothetical protein yinte0001_19430 [Yersinia intermedia ATCC 29909]CRY75655.1 Uncharacterised protein [Yersinia intermedia]VDZ55783.1 Uncharacterised protein [Yersinia intermedia]
MTIFSFLKIPTFLHIFITFLLVFASNCQASYMLGFISSSVSNGVVVFRYAAQTTLPVLCMGDGSPTNPGGSWDIGYPGYGYPGPNAYAQCTWNGWQYSSQWLMDIVELRVPLGLVRENVCPTVRYLDYGILNEYNLACQTPPIVQPLSCNFGSTSSFIIAHGDVSITDIKNNANNAIKTITGNIVCTGSGSGTVNLSVPNTGFLSLATDSGGTLRTMLVLNGTLGSTQVNVTTGTTNFEIRSMLNIVNNYTSSGAVSGSTTLTLSLP